MFLKQIRNRLNFVIFFVLLAVSLCCIPSPFFPWATASQISDSVPEPFIPDSKDASFAFDCVLLGGFIKGQWINAYEHQNNPLYSNYHLWGGSEFDIFFFDGTKSTGIACAVHSEHEGEFEGTEHEPAGLLIFDIQKEEGLEHTLKFGSARFAANCAWNPVPRQAAAMPTDDEASLSIVHNWLQQKGLPAAEPRIVQAFRVDLDGDGQTELLISAQNIITPGSAESVNWKSDTPLPQAPSAPKTGKTEGQYSVILLGKNTQDTDKIQIVPLAQFHTLNYGRQVPCLHKICYFADLNGDGILEVITGERQGKRLRYAVYTPQGERVLKVPSYAPDNT